MSMYNKYPAVDDNYSFPPEVRQSLADSQEMMTQYADKQSLDNVSNTVTQLNQTIIDLISTQKQPAYITIKSKILGIIPYTLITVHCGGSYTPGITKKYLHDANEVIDGYNVFYEHSPFVARDNSGATLINNASGLIHFVGYPDGEGNKVRLRGAVIKDGVAVNEFPKDGWTGHEAFGALPNGKFKGYSTRRGDSTSTMLEDSIVDTISSFGPILIEDGLRRDLSDPFWNTAKSEVSSLNGMGQRRNGDIILVNTPGVTHQSGGTIVDQANILLAEGCEFGFNLDRGGSSQCLAGATPILVSGDAGNIRYIADYLYFMAPITSPVPPQKIAIKLASGYSTYSDTYPPVYWITPDNMVHFSGQIKKTDDTPFLNQIYVLFTVPEIIRATNNQTGPCLGIETGKAVSRRILFNTIDRGFKLLGDGTAQSAYIDITGVSWQL